MSTFFEDLQQQLAAALRELETSEEEDNAVDREWDELMEQFTQAHPDLASRREKAMTRRSAARRQVDALREKVRQLLTGDMRLEDLPEGFAQTREKLIEYDPDALVKACVQHAPFLLVVDEKRLEKFIGNLVVDEKTHFSLPAYIREWLPISVTTGYKARISDATLQKLPVPEEPLRLQGYKDGETAWTHITGWKRVEFEGRTTVWECSTIGGFEPVRIFWETTDPDHRRDMELLDTARYGDYLGKMALGDSQSWATHPIEVGIIKLGSSWRLECVRARAMGARPDAPEDVVAPAAPATVTAYIIGLKRGETSNSKSPKWECTTLKPVPKGLRIFSHEDPDKDSFRFFAAAGYHNFLSSMEVGQAQDWTAHPIEVQIAGNGDGWWNIVSVTPRAEDAEPDNAALERLKDRMWSDEIPF